jgi:hypothetical protein
MIGLFTRFMPRTGDRQSAAGHDLNTIPGPTLLSAPPSRKGIDPRGGPATRTGQANLVGRFPGRTSPDGSATKRIDQTPDIVTKQSGAAKRSGDRLGLDFDDETGIRETGDKQQRRRRCMFAQ